MKVIAITRITEGPVGISHVRYHVLDLTEDQINQGYFTEMEVPTGYTGAWQEILAEKDRKE